MLFSQQFSAVPSSHDVFLNFGKTDTTPAVWYDEANLLAWQNTQYLPQFTSLEKAQKYCSSRAYDDLAWRLPTVTELKTLYRKKFSSHIASALTSGEKKAFLASDQPIWDTKLWYGFNYSRGGVMIFKKETKRLFVRCVSSLE